MSYIPDQLRILVIERANNRCEYCLLSGEYAAHTHEIDHVRAEKHRGQTIETNLSLSCFDCNRYKGTDLASVDPETDEVVPLFNPRQDIWADHFELVGATIIGRTPRGRATTVLLRMNDLLRVEQRAALIALQRYP